MDGVFDTQLECMDWRYSAAMVGLKRYFDFSDSTYPKISNYCTKGDCMFYNRSDIYEDRFLAFTEYFFQEDMSHKKAENLLVSKDTFSEEEIKAINENLLYNSILKKIFTKVKFNGENKQAILELIEKNRHDIILETFKNKSNLYANYCNPNLLFKQEQPHCRLIGYNIDEGRKSKSYAYNFNKKTFVGTDRIEFDFIPFAFTNTYEALFINNNWNLTELFKANNFLANKIREQKEEDKYSNRRVSARVVLFKNLIESSSYLDYDIEVIIKNRDHEYFESLFIRRKAIEILKAIGFPKVLNFHLNKKGEYYIDTLRETLECIVNEISVDYIIETLLKADSNYCASIYKLVEVNCRIKDLYKEKGENELKAKLSYTRKCAEDVVKSLERNGKNKIKSYRQKLTSAIVAEDYDRFCEILLQLSAYAEVPLGFSYDLFEDFEKNKDIAYTFVAALDGNQRMEKKETNKE